MMASAAPAAAQPQAAVHLTRRLPARREEVFRAWTEPEIFARWFSAPLVRSPGAVMDVRVGGLFRVGMKPALGRGCQAVGTYLEVEPPARLVFTFRWEPNPLAAAGMGDSRVIVQLDDLGPETELRLTHERLGNRRLRAFHRAGWNHSLNQLDERLHH